jgi:hypothetical protein
MERVLFRPLLVFRGEMEAPRPGDLGEGMPSRWWVVQGKEVTGVTDKCKQTMLATSKGDEKHVQTNGTGTVPGLQLVPGSPDIPCQVHAPGVPGLPGKVPGLRLIFLLDSRSIPGPF